MLEVKSLIAKGQMQEAEDLCNTLLKVDGSALGYHLLGYIAQQTGRYSLSINSCIRANDLGLQDWSNHLILGLSLKAIGEHDGACHAFEAAHRMSPLSIDAAVFFLEETCTTKGFEAAESVYQSFSPDFHFSPALQGERLRQTWHKIVEMNRMASIQRLMRAGLCDKAEDACRAGLIRTPSKNLYRLLGHIGHHKRWRQHKFAKNSRFTGSGMATISVMLITYNHEKYIAQALDSILMQETEYEFEIIVIEDCSTDKTRDVIMEYVDKYPGKIKTFFNPRNIGTLDPPQQKVTYEGFKRLSGDYFAILEGDDYWSSPHKLQKQISFLENNPDFIACAHNTIKKYEDGSNPPHRFLYWENTKDVHTVDDLIIYSFFHTSSIVYRNCFRGKPPRFFRSKWSCDIFLNIYYAHHGNIKYFNDDMSVYRAHSDGLYSTMSKIKGDVFNINGLRNYNRWLGYRYLKSFSFQIARRCQLLLEDESIFVPALTRLKYTLIRIFYNLIFRFLSHFPIFDPAVFWHREPLK